MPVVRSLCSCGKSHFVSGPGQHSLNLVGSAPSFAGNSGGPGMSPISGAIAANFVVVHSLASAYSTRDKGVCSGFGQLPRLLKV